jgi:hypothetical protein
VKVSVLIPVFNGEDHLSECLESVLAQDFRDLEILIANDGSSDGSHEIIKNFAGKDSRIRWWTNPRNLGLTGNANHCLKAAQGEYIKFVHQDDKLLSPSTIQKMVTALDQNPGASLVGSLQHVTGGKCSPKIFSKKSGCYDGRRMIVVCLEENTNLIGQPTLTLFRRLQAQRGFDERYTGQMDYEMWFHLLEQGDYVYLHEPLATWRIHSRQQTQRNRQTGLCDHESLLLLETYYHKPWLQSAATQRMLFVQSRFLRRKYGSQAAGLVKKMRAPLQPMNFLGFWLRHKLLRPLKEVRKLADKAARLRQPREQHLH